MENNKPIKVPTKKLSEIRKEIDEFFKNPKIEFGSQTKKLILNKKYDRDSLIEITILCSWFLENYPNGYNASLLGSRDGILLGVKDSEGNLFVDYTISHNVVTRFKWDTDHIRYLKESGKYNEQIHHIVEVPFNDRLPYN